MNDRALTAFRDDYLATWAEPDATRRRRLVERIWAPDGRLVASAFDHTVEGVEAITAHLTAVYEERIAGQGLTFSYDQAVEAGEALLLRWSMTAAPAEVVGRGVDLVFRDTEGRARTVYMFMGVD